MEAVKTEPFSKTIREGSWTDHDDSEGADFMANIMRGKATLDDYIQLVVQHYYMYEVLEDVAAKLVDDPVFSDFYDANLLRMEALHKDLQHFYGDDWREKISPVQATTDYAARMREVYNDLGVSGVVAHHYTRYLGDLSGGQMIARRVAMQHGFENGEGIEFYNFKELGSIDDFKNRYRDALDKLGEQLDETQKAAMLEEVRLAYKFNTDVFIDLHKAKQVAAEG